MGVKGVLRHGDAKGSFITSHSYCPVSDSMLEVLVDSEFSGQHEFPTFLPVRFFSGSKECTVT